MTKPVRKKLIEVSIPLEAINKASAREKSIRHGHPSTLHLWWARRPLAACRAVLLAQLVDDPSAWPDRFPTEEAQDIERRRLHKVIEDMVPWEASNDDRILNAARWEIARSVAWGLGEEPPPKDDGKAILDYLQTKAPPVYDPFSGGGSIPLEAQRLGLRAYGSDLNPVAVLIGKALVEIPPKFAGQPPVNPKAKAELKRGGNWNGRGAQGLADDVRYYGQWMRDEAEKRIGHLYPKAKLPDGSEATVIAWLWARTVICPNPACKRETPLLSSFVLSSKKGREYFLVPSEPGEPLSFSTSKSPPPAFSDPSKGLKRGMSGIFQCLHCGDVTSRDHVAEQGTSKKLGHVVTAVVAEGKRGRVYLGPESAPLPENLLRPDLNGLEVELAPNPRDVWCRNFGLDTPASLFTLRQLVLLTTYSDLISRAREMAFVDAREAGLRTDLPPLHLGGVGAAAYADAVATYLGMAVSKLSDAQSSLARWKPSMDQTIATFGRQALPMVWDYAESNAFAGMAGDFLVSLKNMMRVLGESAATTSGSIGIIDAAQNSFPVRPVVISTDPPYYDNIGYSDLSDFFYVWLKRALSPVWPDLFRRLIAPKAEELVATPYRHGGKSESEAFFMQGMSAALTAMKKASTDGEPLTIYYAFKQSEAGEDGVTSAGWASILQAVVDAGLAIDGTWPIRTELLNRMIGRDTNALASSIVLVCRKQIASADTAMRDEFLRSLQRELPEAISGLKKAGIAPVDMRQSIIGPGMGIFTRYKEVLEDSDRPMRVKAALAVISNVWNEISQQLDADLDVPTQLALEWYESFAFDRHSSSTLITSSGSADVSVNDLFSSGVFEDLKGNTRLTPRESLPDDWSPATDRTLTVWECVQHTARVLNADEGGAEAAAKLVAQMGSKAADARALAYRLFEIATQKGWTAEALVYNELAQEWPKLEGLAASDRSGSSKPTQRDMFVS